MGEWSLIVGGAAMLLCAYNMQRLQVHVFRQHAQIARLTRRVWILEGRPEHDCEAADHG